MLWYIWRAHAMVYMEDTCYDIYGGHMLWRTHAVVYMEVREPQSFFEVSFLLLSLCEFLGLNSGDQARVASPPALSC